jgi:hypothetical protein
MSVCVTGLSINLCSCNGRASLTVCNGEYHRVINVRIAGASKLEEMDLVERVKSEQDVVHTLDLLLTPSDRDKLIIKENAPELGRCLRLVRDGGNKVIVELCIERAASRG